jgi:hypothetical protein
MDWKKQKLSTYTLPRIIEAIIAGEIIEDYPDDRRRHSCLFRDMRVKDPFMYGVE